MDLLSQDISPLIGNEFLKVHEGYQVEDEHILSLEKVDVHPIGISSNEVLEDGMELGVLDCPKYSKLQRD